MWFLSFATHIPMLYRPLYNETNRLQAVDYNWYQQQFPQSCSSTSCDETDNSAYKTFLALFIIFGALFFVSLYYNYHISNQSSRRGKSSTQEIPTTSNPVRST
jgi:hypothetical protein